MEHSESTLLETYPEFGNGELWHILQDEVVNQLGLNTVKKQIVYVNEILKEVDLMIEKNASMKAEEKLGLAPQSDP